jgi:hypothetical protein
MPLSLLNHSALALFAQRTRIPTSARSIGFCAIWVCISSSSSLYFIPEELAVADIELGSSHFRTLPTASTSTTKHKQYHGL